MNENQNNQNLETLNNGTTNFTTNPTGPVPPVMPVNPMSNEAPLQNNFETLGSVSVPPSSQESVMPSVSNGGEQILNMPTNPSIGINQAGTVPQTESINLQPEGVVPTAPVNEQAPSQTIEPLMSTPLTDMTNLGQTTNLNNPTETTPNMNMGQMPNMGMPNNMNMMGVPTPPTLPENQEKKAKKSGNNKILLILLIIFLIAAVGFGVYYVLNKSQSKVVAVSIEPVLTQVELGTTIKVDAVNFAKVTGYDIDNCTVSTDLDTSQVGTYEYTVTCGSKTSTATKVQVKDTEAPEVLLQEVIVTPDTLVDAEDFLLSVTDASEWDIEADPEDIDTSTEGTYKINLIVSDVYENATMVIGTLIVDANAPTSYLYCDKEDDESENEMISYRFGMNNIGEIYNTKKTYTFQYDNEDDYYEAIDSIDEEGSLDGLEGDFIYNDKKFIIEVTTSLDNTELETEFETSITSEDDIQTLFDYQCYNID